MSNTNNIFTATNITRLANGKSVFNDCGVLFGDRQEMETCMRRKARAIREANRGIHVKLYIDWNPEEVPFDYGDYTDWVLCPVGDITVSR